MERSDGNTPDQVTCTCVCVCVCVCVCMREREREEGSKSCTGICEILWYMNNTW